MLLSSFSFPGCEVDPEIHSIEIMIGLNEDVCGCYSQETTSYLWLFIETNLCFLQSWGIISTVLPP